MKQGQAWLGKRLGISQGRVSQLVTQGRIPRKAAYTDADVRKLKPRLMDDRAANNAASVEMEEGGEDDAIKALSRNPERIARIKLLVERTAKIKLERELLAGGYIKKEEAERERVARIFSVRAKLQEIPLRSSLIAHRSEAECERILTDWVKEVCDFYAGGGN
jgi:hypothetical protein